MATSVKRVIGETSLDNGDVILTVREFGERLVDVLESAHDIRKTRSGPEVLLLQTELLTDCTEIMSPRYKAADDRQ